MTKIDKNWTKLKKWTKIENWTKIGQNWKFDKNWKIGQKLKIGQKIGICTNVNCFQFFYFQFSTVKKSCRISDLQVIGVARGKMVFFFFFLYSIENMYWWNGIPKNDPEDPERPIRPTVVKRRSLFSGQNPSSGLFFDSPKNDPLHWPKMTIELKRNHCT